MKFPMFLPKAPSALPDDEKSLPFNSCVLIFILRMCVRLIILCVVCCLFLRAFIMKIFSASTAALNSSFLHQMAGSFVQICDVAFRKWNLNFLYTFVSRVSGCARMNRIHRMNSRKLKLCSVEIPKYFVFCTVVSSRYP